MRNIYSSKIRFSLLTTTFFALCITANAADDAGVGQGSGMVFILIGLLSLAAAAAFIFWRKSKKPASQDQYNYTNRVQNHSNEHSYDVGVDAEKELEWFRKAKKSTVRSEKIEPLTERLAATRTSDLRSSLSSGDEMQLNAQAFQQKMKRMQFAQLPVNSFLQLADPRDYDLLPLSSDPALLSAIEQANEEYEEDEAVRELALRILTQFKTRNSVEALAQIALYDLSSNLRSKAVATLTEFDHESVFETILLACADPTREVRAAAARGLFRLSFDRADAWKRIIATKDEFRMSHAARAATESGIVVKSFDRLLHDDMKIAYEAFALVGLLIRSGETAQIFDAIRNSKDERIKLALLHVLSVVKDDRALRELNKLRIDTKIPEEIAAKVKEAVESYHPVMA